MIESADSSPRTTTLPGLPVIDLECHICHARAEPDAPGWTHEYDHTSHRGHARAYEHGACGVTCYVRSTCPDCKRSS